MDSLNRRGRSLYGDSDDQNNEMMWSKNSRSGRTNLGIPSVRSIRGDVVEVGHFALFFSLCLENANRMVTVDSYGRLC